jgi:hypothetical protein
MSNPLEAVLNEVVEKASDANEALTLGIILERVGQLDPTLGSALEKAVGNMSKVLMTEAYLAGARHGKAMQRPQPKKGFRQKISSGRKH